MTETAAQLNAMPFDAASPIWADVKPIPQSDTDAPLCPILYSPEYSTAMDLLRALRSSQEHSARALTLTEHLVRLNPSNFTVWDYRAHVLINGTHFTDESARSQALKAELDLLDDMATGSMKNYQIWQQRKRIVVALDDPSRELDFTARILDIDSKNYHTWVYRQWVLCRFGGLPASSTLKGTATAADVALPSSSVPSSHPSSSSTKGNTRSGRTFPELWSGELAYTDQLLEEDVRNNSAWNHRFFVLFASGRAKACEADSDSTDEAGWVRREIGFTKAKIAMTPNNASAWNYLRGISRLNPSHSTSPLRSQACFALSLIPSHAEARASPSMDSGGLTSWYALEWLLDCEQEAAQQQLSASSSGAEQAQSESKRQIEDQTRLILARLLVADPMRKRYWHYKAERILSTLDRV